MSTKSVPPSVAASDRDGQEPHGGPGVVGTLNGKLRLLGPSAAPDGTASVRVSLEPGAVQVADVAPTDLAVPGSSPSTVVAGGWGWRDDAETGVRTGLGIRRLGVADGRGVAVTDAGFATLALPLLRVGPSADVAAMASELVALASWLADLDGLTPGDGSEALYCHDDDSAAGWDAQTGHLDAGLATAGQLWAEALDYGSVDDEEAGSDVWFCRE